MEFLLPGGRPRGRGVECVEGGVLTVVVVWFRGAGIFETTLTRGEGARSDVLFRTLMVTVT